MKLMNALPKNKAFRKFCIFVWEYDNLSHVVPIRMARQKYMNIRTPYARKSRYDF